MNAEPMRRFTDRLRDRWHQADTLVCVGLDPEPAKFPAKFAHDPDAIFHFCRDIVDATAPVSYTHLDVYKRQRCGHRAGTSALQGRRGEAGL